MDRRRALLVNIGEAETDAVLQEVAEKPEVRVFAKPRLADVLNIERSGLSDDLYRYALKAHLDFVVAQQSDGRVHFAVEFDGPYHQDSAVAQRNDAMKNEICERLGLPLLRIDADFLHGQGLPSSRMAGRVVVSQQRVRRGTEPRGDPTRRAIRRLQHRRP
jgi:hypothetical protein